MPFPFTAPATIEKQVTAVPGSLLVRANGTWSNYDIWLEADTGWIGIAVGVILNVFIHIKGERQQLLGPMNLHSLIRPAGAIDGQAGGGRTQLLLASLRGHPCDGLSVEVSPNSPAALATSTGFMRVVAWGDDAPPELLVHQAFTNPSAAAVPDANGSSGFAEIPSSIYVGQHPIRRVELFAWDNVNQTRFVALQSDGSGHLLVSTVGGAGTPYTQGSVTPTAAFASMLDTLPQGIFNAAGVVVADGQVVSLQVTSTGALRTQEVEAPQYEDNTNGTAAVVVKPLAVSTYCKSQSTNNGAANATNVKASAGNLFSVVAYNNNAAARWLFFVNTAGTPVAGSASVICPLLVPGNGTAILGEDFFGTQGLNFATGIGLAMMTTPAGGTLGTAGECFWTATFK